ncbi:hypothetical protein [Ruminococcus flavefaciens]|uniref:Uncharacterized protein n=1 Tax=Ruminococcus flavefaciens TaxID=1265 RepID=A0A1M7IIC3_RUMFL|nr:hypothetical protein [Ruminococcus flavefaciens]SHM40419.1 hypothetical protein SAMN04487860_104134 [Ruminococcus flavefaciens]
MKQTIDYTFKEVSDNKEGKTLFGFSLNTVSKCINRIENTYFDGKKLYHGLTNSKNNAIIFRHEIKGLLLLLLKLELEDVFRDGKSKDTGISTANVEIITETYTYALDNLSGHEYQVLMHCFDIENGIAFVDIIKDFKDELKRVLILLATKYHDHPANYYTMFIKRIRDISVSMIYGSHELRFLNRRVNLRSLDLRLPVLKAITLISNDMYYYDDNNICKRRYTLPEEYEKYEDIWDGFYDIRNIHLYCAPLGDVENQEYDLDIQTELNEKELKEQGEEKDIYTIRDELSNILQELYEQEFPIKQKNYVYQLSQDKIDKKLQKMKTELKEYIPLFCKMQNLCYGKLSSDEMTEVFQNDSFLLEFQNRRYMLLHSEFCGWSFSKYLLKIEGIFSDMLKENIPFTEQLIDEITNVNMQQYKETVDNRAELLRKEFLHLDDMDFLQKEYSGIIDNIYDIDSHCEALAKNLIAMILKQEADDGSTKSVRMCN